MLAFEKAAARFGSLGATVAGISCDSVPVHQNWCKSIGVSKVPLLSDFNREFVRKYGVVIEQLGTMKAVPTRSVFVIDRKGRIAYAWVAPNTGVLPDVDAVLAEVEKLGPAK